MRDMPSCVTYKLYSEKDTTEEFYYEITASGTTGGTPPTAEVPVTNENMPLPSIPEQATGESNANNASIPKTTQAQAATSETERQNSVTETATQTETVTNDQVQNNNK